MRLPVLHAVATILLASAASTRQVTGGETLVLDLNTKSDGEMSSHPVGFFEFGGFVYYAATTALTGTELFRSDELTGAAELFVDIRPGNSGSLPRDLTPVGSGFVFTALREDTGRELWYSDGTAGGTVLLADIRPGPDDSFPGQLVAAGERVFFSADDGVHGFELWSTDGTSAGTAMVTDLFPGASCSCPSNLTALGSSVFFSGTDDLVGGFADLWVSDGTETGTTLLAAESAPRQLRAAGGQLYFASKAGGNGFEPWVTDGTPAGTLALGDLNPGPGDSDPGGFTELDGQVVFSAAPASAASPFEEANYDLWITNGAPAGTSHLATLFAPGTSAPAIRSFARQSIPGPAEVLLFHTRNGEGEILWQTDGTESGTFPALEISPNGSQTSPSSKELVASGGRTYFLVGSIFSIFSNLALWSSDGTAPGTGPIFEFSPAFGAGGLGGLTPVGDDLWFAGSGIDGIEPFRSDGTSQGTEQVADVASETTTADSSPRYLVRAGDRVFFEATPGGSPDEVLHSTQGTAASTQAISGVRLSPSAVDLQGRLVFVGGEPGTLQRSLWISDGTQAGTELLLEELPLVGGAQPQPTVHQDWVYFTYDDDALGIGQELWRTNGTTTELVTDLLPGPDGSRPRSFASIGDRLYFAARPLLGDFAVFVHSPSTGVTEVLANRFQLVEEFTALGDRVMFVGWGGEGVELWTTDGTPEGTELFIDLKPGPANSRPTALRTIGDRMVFMAITSRSNGEYRPWVTDGTVEGTEPLVDLETGPEPMWLDVEATGDLVFFRTNGSESLWVTDGTPAGTKEILGPPSEVLITSLRWVGSGNRIVMTVETPESGSEVWTSDGTAAGTVQLSEIGPSGSSAGPRDFVRLGNQVLFAADDIVHGEELHAFDFTLTGGYVLESFGYGCSSDGRAAPDLRGVGVPALGGSYQLELEESFGGALAIAHASLQQTSVPYFDCTVFLLPPWFPVGTVGTGPAGVATFPVPVPNHPALVGLPIFFQVFVLGQQGYGMSNGVEALVGF